MNNQNNNIPAGNNKPRLKKVKKPIKRIHPQMPQEKVLSPVKHTINNPNFGSDEMNLNPFQQHTPTPKSKIDPFNVEGITTNNQLSSVKNNDYTPQFITDEQEYNPSLSASTFFNDNKKYIILVAVIAFVIGFIFAKMLGGEQKIVHSGLQEVVLNGEVPHGRARCGKAPEGQGCVLYIMNPQRQELSARDFYDLAAQLTGRQRFVIETGNMRYSNMKIRPGEIGQFNIPPLTQ